MFDFLAKLLGFGPSARVTPPEAAQRVAGGAVLLDVRTPGEFASGHLQGALNIPLDQLAGRVGELDRDKGVVLYCKSGTRSARAAGVLQQAGFTDVADLGPMSAWPSAAD